MKTRSALAVLLVVLVGLVTAFWYVGDKKLSSSGTAATTTAPTRTNQPDTDGDGLRDWEEDLWGTQKNNTDSDSDGVSDGDEVTASTDPRVFGPQKLISDIDKSRALVHKLNYSRSQPLLTPEPADISTSGAIALSALNIVNTSDLNNIRQYGLAVSDTLSPLGKGTIGGAASTTLSMVEKGSYTAAPTITALSAELRSMGSSLALLPVPSSAATIHLAITNDILSLGEYASYMARAEKEPILALESAQQFELKRLELTRDIGAFNQYFRDRNILFDQSESAKIEL